MRLLGVAALLLAGCGGVTPTPLVVYVTPSPSPVPTVSQPTPQPSPTYNRDDVAVDGMIRDGLVKMTEFIARLRDPSEDTLDTMHDMGAWADGQLTLTAVQSPTSCTSEALRLWRLSMTDVKFTSDAFADWAAGGMQGNPDSRATEGGEHARAAKEALRC